MGAPTLSPFILQPAVEEVDIYIHIFSRNTNYAVFFHRNVRSPDEPEPIFAKKYNAPTLPELPMQGCTEFHELELD